MASLACLPVQAFGAQLIVNGDFESGLAGWSSNGMVAVSEGFALLEGGQPGQTNSILQTVSRGGPPRPLVLEFQLFEAGMSVALPPGALPDAAFGSLYFGSVPFGTDPSAGVFETALRLFDLDREGLVPAAGVTVEAVPGRPGWSRLTVPFSTSLPFVTFAVDEVDLNLTPGDSVVALDDVSLTVIPEPAPAFLLLFATGLFVAKRIRPT